MENQEEFNDEMLGRYVKMNATSLPNEAFENQVMLKIEQELAYKKEVHAQLKLSFRIFLFGLIAGVLLLVAIMLKQVLGTYQFEILATVILFSGGVFGVLNISNYRRLIKKYA